MSVFGKQAVSEARGVRRAGRAIVAVEGLEARSLMSGQAVSGVISASPAAEVHAPAASGQDATSTHHQSREIQAADVAKGEVSRVAKVSAAGLKAASSASAAVVTTAIKPLANRLTTFVNSLHVTSNWAPGTAVDWYTGKPTTEFKVGQTDTHCSAFAASVSKRLGINLLRPELHDPSSLNYDGQEYLANAQNFWLNGFYNPSDPSNPSPADEYINANVQTAAQAGWANVSTKLGSNATPYQLALEAQNLANSGYLVVAGILGTKGYMPGNPPPGGPGHIAVIMPAMMSKSQLTINGPAEAQSGAHNYSYTNLLTGFANHLPKGTTQIVQVIGATTTYADPKIQFFFNKNPIKIPAASSSAA